MMLEELLFHPAMRELPEAPATGWLMFLNAMREDMPWVYDLGMDVYHALRSQDLDRINESRRRFVAALHAAEHSRAMRHMFPDDDESRMMIHHLPELVEHFLERSSVALEPSGAKRPAGARAKKRTA